ncbi:uncharacterized protein LOC128771288 [Synchiropus splendidus]|uniref:uncharacterized protein LOC128771288 n=1 Tax=Synchiropus splendidus TaxID=270530 RepID=UPI00237D3993|nr:uncharacterized protein LOC128771288 [Synchiropus splendidus]
MIPFAVMAYRATKHSATGLTPNMMMFGRELTEPVDLVAGLPPDTDATPSPPEYVQSLRERLELAHQIVRVALGEAVQRAKRQYDKSCCRTHYQIGDAVWYLIKGTRNVKNRVRKFLPSYEGPYFILGQLDDLVYRIQKNPRTKVKVVHHDQLKPYRCRDALDNTWALELASSWTPMEVSPPPVQSDQADLDLGLSQLFSNSPAGTAFSSTSSDPDIDTAVFDSPQSGLPDSSGAAVQHHPDPSAERPRRQRRPPIMYGEWVH